MARRTMLQTTGDVDPAPSTECGPVGSWAMRFASGSISSCKAWFSAVNFNSQTLLPLVYWSKSPHWCSDLWIQPVLVRSNLVTGLVWEMFTVRRHDAQPQRRKSCFLYTIEVRVRFINKALCMFSLWQKKTFTFIVNKLLPTSEKDTRK